MSAPITVSEDKLYRALAEFKNEFFRELDARFDSKFERKADLAMLTEARKEIMSQRAEIEALQRWRSYITGALAVLGVAFTALVAVVVHYL